MGHSERTRANSAPRTGGRRGPLSHRSEPCRGGPDFEAPYRGRSGWRGNPRTRRIPSRSQLVEEGTAIASPPTRRDPRGSEVDVLPSNPGLVKIAAGHVPKSSSQTLRFAPVAVFRFQTFPLTPGADRTCAAAGADRSQYVPSMARCVVGAAVGDAAESAGPRRSRTLPCVSLLSVGIRAIAKLSIK